MTIVKNPYKQLENSQLHAKSTLELLGVSKSANNLIGDLSAAAGGGAVLGAASAGAGLEGAAAGEAGAGATAAETAGGSAAGSALGSLGKALAGASALTFLTSGQNWIRLLEVIAGVILVVMGLHQLTGIGNGAIGAAKTAARVAR